MSELKIVENGLVPVYETSTGEKVVYGSELHKVLEAKSNYREWVKRRFRDIDAVENEDYNTVEISTLAGGTPKKEHIIRLDIAKEMAMLERNEKGKQVRRYFIQLEKKYKVAQEIISEKLQDMAQFIEQQSEFNQMVIDKLTVTDPSNRTKYHTNPFNPGKGITERRMKKLNSLVSDVASRYGHDRKKTLSYLYQTVEEDMGVSMDAYLQVYRHESNNEDACPLHVIVANNELYDKALELCKNAIDRRKVFG
ncbi:MAG: antA/AntB antirepressor family protein [Roseburia sp.]|nr:antA/AntB antirepressor family protein [Roseburia sp.]